MLAIQIIDLLFWIYLVMLFIRVISSWIPEVQGTRVMMFIMFYTDPYLNFFRRFIPPLGMIDMSPIVAFFFLNIIEAIVKHLAVLLFLK